MSRLALLAAAAAVALAALGGWLLVGRDGGGGPRSEHPVAVPATARTVTVSLTMPEPSAQERRLSAMLEEGSLPPEAMMAEVMSDTDCTPDAEMVSHCRNEMRLADGRTVVVRHPHDMRVIPCLAPDEQVLVVPART